MVSEGTLEPCDGSGVISRGRTAARYSCPFPSRDFRRGLRPTFHAFSKGQYTLAQFPALPLWTDALIGDTFHLTPAEFGAYMRLLICAWRTKECALPNDDARLGKMIGDPKNWHRLRGVVIAYFHLGDDNLYRQKRLSDERDYVARCAERSSAGGRGKSLKNRHMVPAKPVPNLCQTCAPTPTPTPTPTSISSLRSDIPSQSEAIAIADALSAYNAVALACGWAQAAKLTQPRIKALSSRLKEYGGLPGWSAAMTRAAASDFLAGRAPRTDGHGNWAPDLDWLIKAKNFTKLMEGSYDNRKSAKRPTSTDNFIAGGASYIEDLQREIDRGFAESAANIEIIDPSGDDIFRERLFPRTSEGHSS